MTGPAPSSSRQDTQGQRSQGQARFFAMTRQEAAEAPEVIAGKLYLFDIKVYALIDPGATHSFIASNVASHLSVEPGLLKEQLSVRTPLGESLAVRTVYTECLVRIDTEVFPVDLMVLPLLDLDVILGMDWLTRHRAVVNCYTKEVIFELLGQSRVVFCGDRQVVLSYLVSAMSAFQMIKDGCQAYLAHVIDSSLAAKEIKDIPVVREFPDVFPEDLPGLPPDREIEFTIDVIPGVAPISVPPYRMAPLELQELKKQLQELLDKG